MIIKMWKREIGMEKRKIHEAIYFQKSTPLHHASCKCESRQYCKVEYGVVALCNAYE